MAAFAVQIIGSIQFGTAYPAAIGITIRAALILIAALVATWQR